MEYQASIKLVLIGWVKTWRARLGLGVQASDMEQSVRVLGDQIVTIGRMEEARNKSAGAGLHLLKRAAWVIRRAGIMQQPLSFAASFA
jgi:hypothetical protein